MIANLAEIESLFSPLAREMAVKHSVLIIEAHIYETLTLEPIVREACKLHDLNFDYLDIKEALKFSEATTARGLAWWIGIHRMKLTPDKIERMPWYMRLRKDEMGA